MHAGWLTRRGALSLSLTAAAAGTAAAAAAAAAAASDQTQHAMLLGSENSSAGGKHRNHRNLAVF